MTSIYQNLKNDRQYSASTALTQQQFDTLYLAFEACYKTKPTNFINGKPSCFLDKREALFFILYYLKNYPTLEILGLSFGISDATASNYIQYILPFLKKAPTGAGTSPAAGGNEIRIIEVDVTQEAGDGSEDRLGSWAWFCKIYPFICTVAGIERMQCTTICSDPPPPPPSGGPIGIGGSGSGGSSNTPPDKPIDPTCPTGDCCGEDMGNFDPNFIPRNISDPDGIYKEYKNTSY